MIRICWQHPNGKWRHRAFVVRDRANWRGVTLVWIACSYCDVRFTEETKSYPDALLMLEALQARHPNPAPDPGWQD